jgi:hypothetical protein
MVTVDSQPIILINKKTTLSSLLHTRPSSSLLPLSCNPTQRTIILFSSLFCLLSSRASTLARYPYYAAMVCWSSSYWQSHRPCSALRLCRPLRGLSSCTPFTNRERDRTLETRGMRFLEAPPARTTTWKSIGAKLR